MFEAEDIDTRLYLTFRVGGELLAFNVSQVREVLDLCTITRVPRTPEFMRGVINLRGSVIPVLDLRIKFGLPRIAATQESRIVIIDFELEGVQTDAGILTDSVHDVIGIGDDQIGPPPESGAHWRTSFIKGIGKYGSDFILLLDIQKVFSSQDILLRRSVAEQQ